MSCWQIVRDFPVMWFSRRTWSSLALFSLLEWLVRIRIFRWVHWEKKPLAVFRQRKSTFKDNRRNSFRSFEMITQVKYSWVRKWPNWMRKGKFHCIVYVNEEKMSPVNRDLYENRWFLKEMNNYGKRMIVKMIWDVNVGLLMIKVKCDWWDL
jgi:hypothetical protein